MGNVKAWDRLFEEMGVSHNPKQFTKLIFKNFVGEDRQVSSFVTNSRFQFDVWVLVLNEKIRRL